MPLVKIGEKSFQISGRWDDHLLRFRYSPMRRQLEFDQVEQRRTGDYLCLARVVSLANSDIEIVRGGSENRRRYLDFLGAQIEPRYRPALRAYERALRARNALLKSPQARPREIAAYDEPLISHGRSLMAMRAELVGELTPLAIEAYHRISAGNETLLMRFVAGAAGDFAKELAASRDMELRLRQTVVGPHRDEVEFFLLDMAAGRYASEGQQRTLALALKLAQAELFAQQPSASTPILLIDDIFGELDLKRRNALLEAFPSGAQKLVTATNLNWWEKKTDTAVVEISRELADS